VNCLFAALWVLLTEGGELVVIRWRPFPHFGVRQGDRFVRYSAWDKRLPVWRMPCHSGYLRRTSYKAFLRSERRKMAKYAEHLAAE